MISRKTAIKLAKTGENKVFTNVKDVGEEIKGHAKLGMFYMEVYIKSSVKDKCVFSLQKKGYYCKITSFKSLPNECLLYVSWDTLL